MGVPDLRGGLGTSTFYTTDPTIVPLDSENVVRLSRGPSEGEFSTYLLGPRNPKGGDLRAEIPLTVDRSAGRVRVLLRSEGQPRELEIRQEQWSDWLRIKFKLGLLQSVPRNGAFPPGGVRP